MTANIEKHAEAILRACGYKPTEISFILRTKPGFLTACTALGDAMALAMREAVLDHASFAVIGDTVRFIAADDVRAIDPATLRGVSHD